jgi:hypothetical protein
MPQTAVRAAISYHRPRSKARQGQGPARLQDAITPTTGMTAKADSDSVSHSARRCFGSDLVMSPQSCDQQDQGDDLGNYHSRNQYRQ